MKIPQTKRRKALLIVDVQPDFITPTNQHIVQAITQLIGAMDYDMYVCAVFDVDENSLWAQQQNWRMPDEADIQVLPQVAEALKDKNPLIIQKSSRSAFKGQPNLAQKLTEQSIEEVHIVGTATHDCVLATAFEAFDLGFPVYVIEECCEAIEHSDRHALGIDLLRNQNMTNHSCLVGVKDT